MRERLTAIFNTLRQIETKGDSTVLMGDCLVGLSAILQELYEAEKTEEKTRKTDKTNTKESDKK